MWISLSALTPNSQYQQRQDVDHPWLPPRRRGSNMRVGQTYWYQFQNGHTTLMRSAPDRRQMEHFKTYSFYCDSGRLFVYPGDAPTSCIGDGSGNPSLSSDDPDSGKEEDDIDSDSSDNEDEDVDVNDWRELSFASYDHANTRFSQAVFRGPHATIQFPSLNRPALSELIPDRYHLNRTINTPALDNIAFTGEIPILVALIVSSVRPGSLHQALTYCFRNVYHAHGYPRGEGWTAKRGFIVGVWHWNDPQHRGDIVQRLKNFELYNRFVV